MNVNADLIFDLLRVRNDVYGSDASKVAKPFDAFVLLKHTTGKERIGSYCTNPKNNKVKWSCVDFDIEHRTKQDALKFINICRKDFSLIPYLEVSKSGGYHVWYFYKEEVPAWKVRRVFQHILSKMGLRTSNSNGPEAIEVFPKQDAIDEDGFGNFVYLPFHGESISKGRTLFVDYDNGLTPFPDQMQYLKNIKKIEEADLDRIIKESDISTTVEVYERKSTPFAEETNKSIKEKREKLLPCAKRVMEEGVSDGCRDVVAFAMAKHFKRAGFTPEETETIMFEWNVRNKPPLMDHEIRTKLRQAEKYDSLDCETTMFSWCDKEKCPVLKKNEIMIDLLNPVQITDKILSDHRILYSAGTFYKYWDGYYGEFNINEIIKIVKDILKDDFTSHKAKEVIYMLGAETYVNENKLNNTDLLNVKNGLLDIETFELHPHNPDVLSTIQLVVNYNPNATCNKWKQSLEEIFEGDKNKIELLQEIFGLCLTVETKYEKALFCLGEGANGKSVILSVLMEILGNDNYCAIPLEQFNNGHYIASLFGKIANISIETNAKSAVYDSIFKAIVSGDPIEANPKFRPSFTFKPKCKLIFALNNMPRVDDKTDAFFRRLLILRFNKVFKEEDQNKNLKYELLKELDGIFIWSLEGLKRLRAQGKFTISNSMNEEVKEYKKENNNVLLFIEEQCEIGPEVSITKDNLFQIYKEWCKQNGYYNLSKNKFGMELKKYHDIVDARTDKGRYWGGIRAEPIITETINQDWQPYK